MSCNSHNTLQIQVYQQQILFAPSGLGNRVLNGIYIDEIYVRKTAAILIKYYYILLKISIMLMLLLFKK